MAHGPALVCRLLASSVSVAHKAGNIIRDVMQKGDLGIIDKVNIVIYYILLIVVMFKLPYLLKKNITLIVTIIA